MEFVRSYKVCGYCGNHFTLCPCEDLDRSNMILHPFRLPDLPADMLPADHLYRWHVLYQATSIMNCNAHPTEFFLRDYTGAVVHFAAKHKQLLISAANAFVDSWPKPFSWDHVMAELAPEKFFYKGGTDLKKLFSPIGIATCSGVANFVVKAAQLFADSQWSYMSTLHIVLVRVLLTKATAIPVQERQIMAGMSIGLWHTHLTLFNGAPWLALDNSQQRLESLC